MYALQLTYEEIYDWIFDRDSVAKNKLSKAESKVKARLAKERQAVPRIYPRGCFLCGGKNCGHSEMRRELNKASPSQETILTREAQRKQLANLMPLSSY